MAYRPMADKKNIMADDIIIFISAVLYSTRNIFKKNYKG